eukprot:CFRG8017T1
MSETVPNMIPLSASKDTDVNEPPSTNQPENQRSHRPVTPPVNPAPKKKAKRSGGYKSEEKPVSSTSEVPGINWTPVPVVHSKYTDNVAMMTAIVADVLAPCNVSKAVLDTTHLKAVRKMKNSQQMSVFLCCAADVPTDTGFFAYLKECGADTSIITNVREVPVPAYRPFTKTQWNAVQSSWPTVWYPQDEAIAQSLGERFTLADVIDMQTYMRKALEVSRNNSALKIQSQVRGGCPILGRVRTGCVVVDPATNVVISVAADSDNDPLGHAVLRAVDYVAKEQVRKSGEMTRSIPGEPYLCTGYDVYLTKEPCIMCSMALVHSRVRRVLYGVSDFVMGGLGGRYSVHLQEGINHHFDVFQGVCLTECELQHSVRPKS